ncbi:MAG: GTPase Era [Cyanobacteria bacterium]|nr:GTPase Era [Cyanobacteriota bacterium]
MPSPKRPQDSPAPKYKFRSGFVAILGRPNVGKSTLLNCLVGQKIAIESPVAQTTRHRIKGVVTNEKGQIIFLDTPGFSKPLDSLGNYLTQESLAALSEADLFLMVVDGSAQPGRGDQWIADQVKATGKFVLLVLNKSDCLKPKSPEQQRLSQAYERLFLEYPHLKIISLSAKTGKNVSDCVDLIIRKLPRGVAYYPKDAVTDQRLREISAEMIREKVLLLTEEEIPHSVAICIDVFEEAQTAGKNQTPLTKIQATLFVDQKSQKGMLIGKGGQMIKNIGIAARQDLEELLETQVFLDLNVKVKENWRKDAQFLKSLGLAPPS